MLKLIHLILLVLVLTGTSSAKPLDQTEAFVSEINELENNPPPDRRSMARILSSLKSRISPANALQELRFARFYCWNHAFERGAQEGIEYANFHLEKIKNKLDLVAISDLTLCRAYQEHLSGKKDSAFLDYTNALKIAEESKDKRAIAFAMNARGVFESQRGNFAAGLRDLLNAQRFFEELKLAYWSKANLVSVADIYRRIGNFPRARFYYDLLLNSFASKDDFELIAYLRTGLGLCYLEERNNEYALREFEVALKSRGKLTSINKDELDVLVATDQVNIARTYLNMSRFHDAIEIGEKAMQFLKPEHHASYLAVLEVTLGKAHAGLKQYTLALERFSSAQPYIKQLDDVRYQSMLHNSRAEVFYALRDFEKAYNESRLFQINEFKLAQQSNNHLIQNLTIQFDTERQVAENQALIAEQKLKNKELETSKRVRFWQSIFIILALIILMVLVWHANQHLRYEKKLRTLAETDELTKLPNRRSVFEYGEQVLKQAKAENHPMSIIIIDLDFFKKINDEFGHAAGDCVLVHVSKIFMRTIRDNDRIGRIGGEEFLAILPRTDLQQALVIAERIRKAVFESEIVEIQANFHISISAGVSQIEDGDTHLTDLCQRGDKALYKVKANGRNAVDYEIDRQ